MDIHIPNHIPDDFVYVNPGPMWRGPDPKAIGEDNVYPVEDPSAKDDATVDVQFHRASRDNSLVRDHLAHGFLIAKAETTVAEFRRWWDRFGAEYCDWRAEIYSRLPEAVAETNDVPLEVQRNCWRVELARVGMDVSQLNKDEILKLALKDVHTTAASIWEEHKETTTIVIEDAANDLPVTVNWETAIAYARTHAGMEPADLRRWVVKMISEATDYAAKLERLRSTIEATNGTFVQPTSLPDTPLVRDLLSPVEAQEYPRPVRDAYCYWLKIRTYYGWQIPIERVLAVTPAAGSELEPTTWLWKKGNAQTIRAVHWPQRDLVDRYADAIAKHQEQPLREHFLLWLGWMIEQEIAELHTYQELLGQLDHSRDDAVEELPFAIRYRYGMHLGWDIPTWKEWEKAYRGADARAYPWGNAASYEQARLHCWKDGMGPLSEVGAETPLNDKSPYGARHMAGNLSEWVRVSKNPLRRIPLKDGTYSMVPADSNTVSNATFPNTVYLKGGNFVLEAKFANAGFSLSLPGFRFDAVNAQTMWSGFRVIRRIGEETDAE
jgi:formylglycine-generating enzyme required for sulfatase activity